MMPTFPQQLLNKRLIAILFLGFSSGLPLALIGSTLQAWFADSHTSIVTIGTLSLVGAPYALKFLWSPLMDHYQLSWLGRRRSWIFLTQAAAALTLFLLASLNPLSDSNLMIALAFILAFFSASQDAAINAYQTDIVQEKERALSASYYTFAYRIASLISSGLALLLASVYGWKLVYQLMGLLITLCMIATYKAPKERKLETFSQSESVFKTFANSFYDLFKRDSIVIILLFIVFYKFGDALALQLMTNFLLNGLGFSLLDLAWAYKVISFLATIMGGFVAGILLLRLNIFRALLIFGLAQTFSNLLFVLLAIVGKNYLLLCVSMFVENFCSGLSTAALFAFLMSLCNHHYSASQFALLSAIATFGRVFLGPLASYMVVTFGWVEFYIWSFMLCFPGIILLILLKDKVIYHAAQTASD